METANHYLRECISIRNPEGWAGLDLYDRIAWDFSRIAGGIFLEKDGP
jgi:hypothetical protein